MDTEELTLPHPALAERSFVLEPLAEIAGEMVHPVSGMTVKDLWTRLQGT
jgi:2-amino-4-hydroxy-6-hydroxymethyldihydropteridine diphosphokinase